MFAEVIIDQDVKAIDKTFNIKYNNTVENKNN